MNFLILHGTLGNPDDNWFPWVSAELQKLGHQTLRPQLPTPDGQTPANWIKTISDSVKKLGGANKNLIIIAHSRSPLAVCQYLQTIDTSIPACFFISGFASRFPIIKPYDELNYPFDDLGADWNKVKSNCRKFYCFGSDNDPYVPQTALNDFAAKLDTKLNIIPNAGHFNSSSGFTTFPQLLAKIKPEIK